MGQRSASQTSSSIARLLSGYLEPAAGSLPQRLERLTNSGCEIESLLAKHLDGDRPTIATTLARQVGFCSPERGALHLRKDFVAIATNFDRLF